MLGNLSDTANTRHVPAFLIGCKYISMTHPFLRAQSSWQVGGQGVARLEAPLRRTGSRKEDRGENRVVPWKQST